MPCLHCLTCGSGILTTTKSGSKLPTNLLFLNSDCDINHDDGDSDSFGFLIRFEYYNGLMHVLVNIVNIDFVLKLILHV